MTTKTPDQPMNRTYNHARVWSTETTVCGLDIVDLHVPAAVFDATDATEAEMTGISIHCNVCRQGAVHRALTAVTHWLNEVSLAAGATTRPCGAPKEGTNATAHRGSITCPKCFELRAAADALPPMRTSPTGGMRANIGKVAFGRILSLVSKPALAGVGRVLEYGAKKYAARNWEKGLAWVATCDSLLRHTLAFLDGEDFDPETGLPNVHHIMCNAMFLAHFYETGTGTDDRIKVS